MATVAIQNEVHSSVDKAAGRCVLVLFGASGDLTKRKLVPALFNLAKAALLPKDFAILGIAFDDLSLEHFRDQVTSFIAPGNKNSETLGTFKQRLFYHRGDFSDPSMYSALETELSGLDRQFDT